MEVFLLFLIVWGFIGLAIACNGILKGDKIFHWVTFGPIIWIGALLLWLGVPRKFLGL